MFWEGALGEAVQQTGLEIQGHDTAVGSVLPSAFVRDGGR